MNADAVSPRPSDTSGQVKNGEGKQDNWNGRSVTAVPPGQGDAISPDAVVLGMVMAHAQRQQLMNNVLSLGAYEEDLKLDGVGTYTGPVKDGKPHGTGKLKYLSTDSSQRRQYEGEFVNGVRTGRGLLTFQNGDRYMGEFDNNQYHGQGELIYGGWKYIGNFKEGRYHGRGKLSSPKGTLWEGMFENHQLNGPATETRVDGSRFSGNYKDDKPNGFGTLYHPNGCLHMQGNFINGLMQGRGILGFPQGDKVEGLFKDGKVAEGECCVIL